MTSEEKCRAAFRKAYPKAAEPAVLDEMMYEIYHRGWDDSTVAAQEPSEERALAILRQRRGSCKEATV